MHIIRCCRHNESVEGKGRSAVDKLFNALQDVKISKKSAGY